MNNNNVTKSLINIFFLFGAMAIFSIIPFKSVGAIGVWFIIALYFLSFFCYYTIRKGFFSLIDIIFLIFMLVLPLFDFMLKLYCIVSFILIIMCLHYISDTYRPTKQKSNQKSNQKIDESLYTTSPDENNLPFACIILINKKIIYANDIFKNTISCDLGCYITEILPQYELKVSYQTMHINNSDFQIYTNPINYKNHENCFISYFILVPNFVQIKKLNTNPTIVSLIFIDNFQEVTEHIEESRISLLTAVIDRNINTYSQNIGGLVKKFEKDKYIFLFSKDKLETLKSSKFDLLNKVREIEIGNKIPVTLSIGIGIGEESLTQSMEFARFSVDLALGRGGDQVIIKDKDDCYFYGGKSKSTIKNNRVRARVKAYALTELIQEASNVIIMGHKNTDLDCLGASVGVKSIVESFSKDVNIVLGNITSSIDILYNKLLSDANYSNVFISPDKALKLLTSNTLLVIVDAHKPNITENFELLEKSNKIVVFDHHRKSANFIKNPVLVYHEPYASSTSELVTEMLLYTSHVIDLLPVEADALLAGITVDTKNFAFKTGARTFEAAAYLKRKGADSIRVRLLFQNDMDSYKAKAIIVNNSEIIYENMAISICPQNLKNPTLVSAQAADDLLNIYGITASFVLCQDKDKVLISARSLGYTNVQMILEKLDGGGHQTVAGAQLSNCSLDDAIKSLKEAIEDHLSENSN